jgi:hypothetical protein
MASSVVISFVSHSKATFNIWSVAHSVQNSHHSHAIYFNAPQNCEALIRSHKANSRLVLVIVFIGFHRNFRTHKNAIL